MIFAVVLTLAISFAALNHAAVYRSQLQHGGLLGTKLREQDLWEKYRDQQSSRDVRKSAGQKLIEYYNEIYLMDITIGTPPQTITVIPDTGSGDFWVIGAQCTEPQCKGFDIPKKKFNSSLSSTFSSNGVPFIAFYGDEECSGTYARDVFSINSLSYPTQSFATIKYLPEIFGFNGIDGVLGLGWPALASRRVDLPMQNLLSQLDEPIFTVYMKRDLNQPERGSGGQITFGGYDQEHCDSKVSWLTVTTQAFWQFTMTGFEINQYSSNNWQQVSSDTSSAYIGLPDTYLFDVVSEIPNAGYNETLDYFTVPCDTQKTGPDMIFWFSGFNLAVPAAEYIADLNLSGDICVLAVYSAGTPGFGPSLILGAPFIRTYCNIHELVNGKMGFAKAKVPS